MPKLSENSLQKRFQCDYCGDTFRTRQGLSGHIQFKHHAVYGPGNKTPEIAMGLTQLLIEFSERDRSIWRGVSHLPQSTTEDILKLLDNWKQVLTLFYVLKIELTKEDFKTYLLAGLGKIFS